MRIAAVTHNQASSALLFLYRAVQRTERVVATLLDGAGLRLLEALRLRVKDVDLERRDITVRSGKSDRDRVTMLAEPALAALRRQLERVRTGHTRDLARAAGWVELPPSVGRKSPGAGRDPCRRLGFTAQQ